MSSVVGFTEFDYRRLLLDTKASYNCVGFEVLASEDLPSRFAIIRHDIDYSPERSLALARIEADLGVRASYTVLLTGEYYSPFEKNIQRMLMEIDSLGHDIGLHFDAAWHEINDERSLEDSIRWEANTLQRLLQKKEEIKFFSFHNTTPFTMACRSSKYAGLFNAYAGTLQDAVQYTSDSNGYWIHRTWDELLNQAHERIQVLTHPEWWRLIDAEPGEKIAQELFSRAFGGWSGYCDLLAKLGRNNKTGLPVLFDNADCNIRFFEYLWLSGYKEIACLAAYNSLRQNKGSVCFDFFDSLIVDLYNKSLSESDIKSLFCKLISELS